MTPESAVWLNMPPALLLAVAIVWYLRAIALLAEGHSLVLLGLSFDALKLYGAAAKLSRQGTIMSIIATTGFVFAGLAAAVLGGGR